MSYEETGPATPVFFVLSPGVDPLKDVEAVGKKLGFTLDAGNFHNVSLGQVCVTVCIFICVFVCMCLSFLAPTLLIDELLATG